MWPRDQCCTPAVRIPKSLKTRKVPYLVHMLKGLHQKSASIYNLIVINPHISTVQKTTDLQDFKFKISHISISKSSSL